ncbi:MAG: HAMP domain-containing sensor histidine kinase [Tissierellia bacterium]|nr:HAMP domain-containing sensor histidine kinase [Tissierellia bacterium]
MSQMNRKLRDFSEYLKYRKEILILSVIIGLLYSIIIYIFELSKEIAIYGFILNFSLIVFYIIIDYRRYKKILHMIDREEFPENLSGIEAKLLNAWKDKSYELSLNKRNELNKLSELEDFYTIWAHQIKTPISAMLLILDDMEGKDKEIIQSELFKIEEYIQIIMAYLKLGKQGSDYYFKKYNIDDILKDSVRKYSHLFIKKKIRLEYNLGQNMLITDSKWLGIVFDQILSNALKYTKKGNISINWENENILSIEDTGIGIPKDDIPRVTELGYTGYNGRIYSRSTGVGLHLCKRVMVNLGGDLSVESKLGEGTKIILKFNSNDI